MDAYNQPCLDCCYFLCATIKHTRRHCVSSHFHHSFMRPRPERKHGSPRVSGHAFLASRSSCRMVVCIYYITSAGNSIILQLDSSCQGNRYSTEKAGGTAHPSHSKSHLPAHSPPASQAGRRIGPALQPSDSLATTWPRLWRPLGSAERKYAVLSVLWSTNGHCLY